MIALIGAVAVADVVRLLVDVAIIFRNVTRRLSRLAVPIAAYSSLWSLLAVGFGCLYRIADGASKAPLFHGSEGPMRLGFSDALHFSVVTLSAVGYGDIQPMDDGIRLLAGLQMLAGQLLLLFGFLEIVRGSRLGVAEAGEGPHAAPENRRGAAGE
nr:potassium channel family protein [Siccirubricoccus soli]